MPSKRQRPSGTWEFTVQKKGLLDKPMSLTFDTEIEGDEYCKKIEFYLNQGIIPPELLGTEALGKKYDNIRHVINAYRKTVHVPSSDDDYLTTSSKLIGDVALTKINYDWAENWVVEMKTRKLAPSTIRHYVGSLARCFDWAGRKEITSLAVNPLRQLPRRYATYNAKETKLAGRVVEDVSRDRRLSQDGKEETQIREVLAEGSPLGVIKYRVAMETLFILGLESAMRLREMYTLKLSQLDFNANTIFLEKTKNGSKRQVPMTTVVNKVLSDYIQKVIDKEESMNGFAFESENVFPWWNGKNDNATLKAVSTLLSYHFGRVFDLAQCVDFKFHDLRHEATARLYERTNLSDVEISNITGHTDLKMLKRYANLRGSNLAKRLW
ncbi:XerC Integrase [uncultured Caudovirales phage]|uniref:Integrase n=1 Tax=uncultured Caudovirales phage TaxID=2100421 RepID=A0A6J5KN34_9CAUD|nr:XerC Integrase [uncultured Caudovirales phage]CAB4123961.1 XerC Integrase [uncultured Caudovirales phage]CAB5219518.1 XerC Integrase [uncultured Caudovirales phage]